MRKGIFVSGTSTSVGKTVISACLCTAALSQNLPIHYFKPVQTGEDSDSKTIKALTQLKDNQIISPVYAFPAPLSPNRAARLTGQSIDIDGIVDYWERLPAGCYIVEGAGGLLVPLQRKVLIRDLVKRLKLPLLVVANTHLGTINHTLLTIEAARHADITVCGIVLHGEFDPGLAEILTENTGVPVLAELPWIPKISKESVKIMAESFIKHVALFF